MHSLRGFTRFAIYEQTWNGPPSTLPLQYSFGSKGMAAGMNLFFHFCLLLPGSMLCHIWRRDRSRPSGGRERGNGIFSKCGLFVVFYYTLPHFLNFKYVAGFFVPTFFYPKSLFSSFLKK